MGKKIFLLVFVAILLLISGFYSLQSLTRKSKKSQTLNSLTFSNTMQWDPQLLKIANRPVYWLPDWQKSIHIPDPPANTSPETQKELQTLLLYKKTLRTPETIITIQNQMSLSTTRLNNIPLTNYLDETKYPLTASLLQTGYNDISIIMYSLKKKYDRVRPSILEPSIQPVITIPGHPAYPSGHSTQAHFLAYILAKLIPHKADAIIAQADAIAKNREIAGLHYPSDSKAGKILARQFTNALLQNKEFQRLLEQAKKEW